MTPDPLFRPIKVGDIDLSNRIVMASMSRARTENPNLVPTPLQAEYYRQRASAGLIVTEGTWPSREAIGAVHAPGLFTETQAEGWKRVTDAVHDAGGRIVVQLGHTGSASHPDLLGGFSPFGPSEVGLNQPVFTPAGFRTSPVPRAMTLPDIERTIADYARSTRLAQAAGFDGVELHGTVGYLIPQFLNERFNLRKDRYGGSIENRVRLPLEILAAMISEWRASRIGLKLSPAATMGTLHPTDQTLPTYELLVRRASAMRIAYLQLQHIPEDATNASPEGSYSGTVQHFRDFFDGPIIANGGLDRSSAATLLRSGAAELVAFGTPYLANPDLVERLRDGLPLSPVPPRETWYAGGSLDTPTIRGRSMVDSRLFRKGLPARSTYASLSSESKDEY